MNLIDRTIEAMAPRYALRRMQARAALTLTQDYMERHAERFAYDGSSAGRRGARLVRALERRQRRVDGVARVAAQSQPRPRSEQSLRGEGDRGTGRQWGRHRDRCRQSKTGNAGIDKIIDAEWPFFVEVCDTPQRWISTACRLW